MALSKTLVTAMAESVLLGDDWLFPLASHSCSLSCSVSNVDDVASWIDLAKKCLRFVQSQSSYRRKECPLVVEGPKLIVYRDAVALFAWTMLQGQGYEISESGPRHGVLAWKQAIIGMETYCVMPLHRSRQDSARQLSGQRCLYGIDEEYPDMSSVSRA
jgi:hypothetical protein